MNAVPLDVAGINATILSLLIASLFAYGLYIYTSLQSMDEDALREAEKVNQILVRGTYGVGAGWRDWRRNNVERNLHLGGNQMFGIVYKKL